MKLINVLHYSHSSEKEKSRQVYKDMVDYWIIAVLTNLDATEIQN